jgi:hypothetical protein
MHEIKMNITKIETHIQMDEKENLEPQKQPCIKIKTSLKAT